MCGIIGVLSRRSTRPAPTREELLGGLDEALGLTDDLPAVVAVLSTVDMLLRGVPGVAALADHPETVAEIASRLDRLDAIADEFDAEIEASAPEPEVLELLSARSIAFRDVLWALRHDRLRTAREVGGLAGRNAGPGAVAGYLAVQQALSAIDRLEVRGRDSAGIHVFVSDHGLDLSDPTATAAIADRSSDPTYQSGSVRLADGVLSFVYKKAAEIGELGDNTRALRAAVASDDLLRRALSSPAARTAVLGHTRWASVGIISEPNTHPLNSDEMEQSPVTHVGPYVVAALNGDVDNHADLRVEHHLAIHQQVTTDAKVIPTIMSRHAAAGVESVEAFRRTVSAFEGSVAIAAMSGSDPDRMYLALRGSGQGLYVGLADDCFVVASEPYGVVEETSRYVRMDGEAGGEVVVLDATHAGELAGITRLGYDGGELPLADDDVVTAEVTTRDIDRGDAPHFLLKEIGEAPRAFRRRCAPRSSSVTVGSPQRSASGRCRPGSPSDWRPVPSAGSG